MEVTMYQQEDGFLGWEWWTASQVFSQHHGETGFAIAGYPFWPVSRYPEPWSQEIELKMQKHPITHQYISLWVRPSTLKDMQPDSYEPEL